MNDDDVDALLRRAPPDPPQEVPVPSVDTLLAWRNGRLSAEESAEIEAQLARSPAGRAQARGMAEEHGHLRSWAAQRFPKPRRVRAKWIWMGPMAVAAAVVLAIVGLPLEPRAPGPYRLTSLEGGVQERRGAASPSRTFLPGSQLRLVVTPESTEADPGNAAALYRLDVEGRLISVPATVRSRSGAFQVEGSGQELLGQTPGVITLVVCIGANAAALQNLEGKSPSDLSWLAKVPLSVTLLGDTAP